MSRKCEKPICNDRSQYRGGWIAKHAKICPCHEDWRATQPKKSLEKKKKNNPWLHFPRCFEKRSSSISWKYTLSFRLHAITWEGQRGKGRGQSTNGGGGGPTCCPPTMTEWAPSLLCNQVCNPCEPTSLFLYLHWLGCFFFGWVVRCKNLLLTMERCKNPKPIFSNLMKSLLSATPNYCYLFCSFWQSDMDAHCCRDRPTPPNMFWICIGRLKEEVFRRF